MERGDAQHERERDYERYSRLLELWSRENPIKTQKLQMLLAVNALLVASVHVAGGHGAGGWLLYGAGAAFCLVWTLSIARTTLFQKVWKTKLGAVAARHPEDPRFSIHRTDGALRGAPAWVRALGSVPSTWYLLAAPIAFGLGWLALLVYALAARGETPA